MEHRLTFPGKENSEVVKLYRPENSSVPDQFILEWSKSRSGLAGKHFLNRESSTYGWFYAGPVDGGGQDLDKLVNALNNRAHSRFDKNQAATAIGAADNFTVGRLLEQARRQGLITSSWEVTPSNSRKRLYHSWDYIEPSADVFDEPDIAKPNDEYDDVLF